MKKSAIRFARMLFVLDYVIEYIPSFLNWIKYKSIADELNNILNKHI